MAPGTTRRAGKQSASISTPSDARLPTSVEALVRMHPPLAIGDRIAYRNTMRMIDTLTRIPKLTAGQSEYLNTLAILADAYENEREPIDPSGAGPLDVLRELMSARGMK